MRTNLRLLTVAVLTLSASAGFAAEAAVDDVCAEDGSPPASFPNCVWAIPVEGGEVLFDTVGTTSASEVLAAMAEGRDPSLTSHALTGEEGALVVEAVAHTLREFSGVVLDDLPTYVPPDRDGPVVVIDGVARYLNIGRFSVILWSDGNFTVWFKFPGGRTVFYDSQHGWAW